MKRRERLDILRAAWELYAAMTSKYGEPEWTGWHEAEIEPMPLIPVADAEAEVIFYARNRVEANNLAARLNAADAMLRALRLDPGLNEGKAKQSMEILRVELERFA